MDEEERRVREDLEIIDEEVYGGTLMLGRALSCGCSMFLLVMLIVMLVRLW
jgi:hypothetical protein